MLVECEENTPGKKGMTFSGVSEPLAMIGFQHVINHLVICGLDIYVAFLVSYIFGVFFLFFPLCAVI